MKTPKEILKDRFSKGFVDLDEVQESMVIECMLEFAMQEVKNLTIPDVGNLLKDKESQTFEDWMEEHCVKLGKYYQYKFEDVLYTEEQLLQKYNTYKLSL